MPSVKIFRYNFSPEFIHQIDYFATIHKYEDRYGFKDKWLEWIDDNQEIVELEKDRLEQLGYNGNVKDKMFTSARYYFKKKQPKNEPKKRKTYTTLGKQMLAIIDEHILNNYSTSYYTQQNGFEDFYKDNEDLLLYENTTTKKDDLLNKVKKTYKNRYFTLMKNIKNCEEENEDNDEENNDDESDYDDSDRPQIIED